MKYLLPLLMTCSLLLPNQVFGQSSNKPMVKPSTYSKIKQQFSSAKTSSNSARNILKKASARVPKKPLLVKPMFSSKVLSEELSDAEARLDEVDSRIDQLRGLTEVLNEEKIRLEIEKQSLATRENLFKKGFYASLTTAVLALLGLLIKTPIFRTEFRIKELEREKLEIEVAALKQAKNDNLIIS